MGYKADFFSGVIHIHLNLLFLLYDSMSFDKHIQLYNHNHSHRNMCKSDFLILKKIIEGTSLAVQWLRLHLPLQGVWVQSLVGELRFPRTSQPKNQNIRQKQYCNKFNKDFKNGPIQSNILKK